MIRTSVITTADPARWRTVLPTSLNVMSSLEYVAITERQTGWPARLFVVENDTAEAVVAYPYFLRSVRELPFANRLAEDYWDTITPEYVSPTTLKSVPDGLRFPELFAQYCREQRIVAEFARLSPWSVPEELLDPACLEVNREIVYVDLTWDEQRIWNKSLTSAGRRQTRQSQQAGVRVRRAETADDVREFHRLHTDTMDRRQALDRYYFPPEYFLSFFETMPDNSFFMLAEYQGRLVAGGLYLQDDVNIYWQLSAMDAEYANVRPVNAYVYETIRQSLRQGKQRMLLGGGYKRDDGVFRFKANFSPLRAQFRTYRRIHDAEICSALTQAWSAHHEGQSPSPGFFPAYRSTVNEIGEAMANPARSTDAGRGE